MNGGLKRLTESESSTVCTPSPWLSQAHTCLPMQGLSGQHTRFFSVLRLYCVVHHFSGSNHFTTTSMREPLQLHYMHGGMLVC